MIRIVNLLEVEKFASLGKWFFESLQLPGKFDAATFCHYWRSLMASGSGFILGRFDQDHVPVEAIGTILFPDVFSGESSACTMFWFYVEEPKGLEAGVLDKAWEQECRDRDIKHLFRGVLCNERIAKVGGYLLKSGYHLAEMQYRKDL